MKKILIILFCFLFYSLQADNGHDLWLGTIKPNPVKIVCHKTSATLSLAIEELEKSWQGESNATVVLSIKKDNSIIGDGFKLTANGVEANTDLGVLYGVFELLRLQRTGRTNRELISNPSYTLRLLNHWDNLDGSIERGYAGRSIFWREQNPFLITPEDVSRWKEYGRANASVGINGAVLNNVNASPKMLSPEYLMRVKAIADVLRPYGIHVYLSVKFSSPVLLDGLKTADPMDPTVIRWWKEKVTKLYQLIPDFGGFLVKANSEGQPGPQDYGRTHADGANMLADALKPHGGVVMWRAFVYNPSEKDRAKQAYSEFVPLDGKFKDNVILQVKNGPVDFQPREPFNPLFGAMKKTPTMIEFQITQEYLGQSIHLAFLSPMWKECLNSDTYRDGKGSTVARCTDASSGMNRKTAIAGVSNIGADANWCGHFFAQANWYAFGRLAWNNTLRSDQIADEWLTLTFYKSQRTKNTNATEWSVNFCTPVKNMMLASREAVVNYMMPLGLHHLFSANEHYGPGPWWAPKKVRADWTPPYYHKADSIGIGFDRTSAGTDAVSQYNEPLASQFNDVTTCPAIYLLWFHHLPWGYTLQNGRTVWSNLCYHYDQGVAQARQFQKTWDEAEDYVDEEVFAAVQKKLRLQTMNAMLWRDACLQYFQQINGLPIPYELERPVTNLEEIIERDSKRIH